MSEYYYPMPNATQSGDIVSLMQYLNEDICQGLFGVGLLMAIFVVLFIATKHYQTEKSFTFSVFITAVLSYLFYLIKLVSGEVIIGLTLIAAISIILLYRLK